MFPEHAQGRRYFITKAKGAVCIMQIGDKLENRARRPSPTTYDDWALNHGHILVYHPVLDIALSCPLWVSAWTKEALLSAGKSHCQACRASVPESSHSKAALRHRRQYRSVRICMFFAQRRTSESAPSARRKSARSHEISCYETAIDTRSASYCHE